VKSSSFPAFKLSVIHLGWQIGSLPFRSFTWTQR
jgi:hypothetical protein